MASNRSRSFAPSPWVVSLALTAVAGSSALPPAASAESAETLREQALALETERLAPTSGLRAHAARPGAAGETSPEGAVAATHPLFAAVDDLVQGAFRIDPVTSAAVQAFTDATVWGSAYDPAGNRVFFNSGSTLWEWPVGGTPNPLGTIVDGGGASQAMVALAYHDGTLYGTKNIATEAIWIIDPTTLVATILATYSTVHDMGGLAVHPETGEFYATDDGTTDSLVRIDLDGTVTPIIAYPAGETDIDGLAIGGGRAYLITDDALDEWSVYDFAAGTYVDTVTSPFTTSETFAAGAWIPESTIFEDGFESGDTSAWDQTVG